MARNFNSMNDLVNNQMSIASKARYEAWKEEVFMLIKNGYDEGILHNPRLVMYKMLGKNINGITATKKNAKHIGAIVNVLKYLGMIKNEWTIDTTRAVTHYGKFNDVQDGIDSLVDSYYLDRWKDQPKKILLMCEASGYLGVIRKIANDFRLPYTPSKGDMSIQMKLDIAKMITPDTEILYFGDYDVKGIDIPKVIERDMSIYTGRSVKLNRLYVNEEDIERFDLTVDETGVQMEQLDEHTVINETKEYINSIIDQDKWNNTLQMEAQHRLQIKSVL